jgi:hypothetical protein
LKNTCCSNGLNKDDIFGAYNYNTWDMPDMCERYEPPSTSSGGIGLKKNPESITDKHGNPIEPEKL